MLPRKLGSDPLGREMNVVVWLVLDAGGKLVKIFGGTKWRKVSSLKLVAVHSVHQVITIIPASTTGQNEILGIRLSL